MLSKCNSSGSLHCWCLKRNFHLWHCNWACHLRANSEIPIGDLTIVRLPRTVSTVQFSRATNMAFTRTRPAVTRVLVHRYQKATPGGGHRFRCAAAWQPLVFYSFEFFFSSIADRLLPGQSSLEAVIYANDCGQVIASRPFGVLVWRGGRGARQTHSFFLGARNLKKAE